MKLFVNLTFNLKIIQNTFYKKSPCLLQINLWKINEPTKEYRKDKISLVKGWFVRVSALSGQRQCSISAVSVLCPSNVSTCQSINNFEK